MRQSPVAAYRAAAETGGVIFVLFCISHYGWGWKKFTAEANTGNGPKVANWLRQYMTYVVPAIVIGIFVIGLVNFFGA